MTLSDEQLEASKWLRAAMDRLEAELMELAPDDKRITIDLGYTWALNVTVQAKAVLAEVDALREALREMIEKAEFAVREMKGDGKVYQDVYPVLDVQVKAARAALKGVGK